LHFQAIYIVREILTLAISWGFKKCDCIAMKQGLVEYNSHKSKSRNQMNLENLTMMTIIRKHLVKQQSAKKFKAETRIREEEFSEDKSATSESVPDLVSQFDEIIQETDEIDDDGRFTLDSIFDFNKFESFQCDDVQNSHDYTEVDEVFTLEDVMSL
jgi:hypothetical protein